MMKSKIAIIACVLTAAFLLGLTGFTLAENYPGVSTEGDRLIGVFVTNEHLDLFDFESYFNDNADKILGGGAITIDDTSEYQGRIYAEMVEKTLTNEETGEETVIMEYEFPDLEGVSFFSPTTINDNGESCISFNGSGVSDVVNSYIVNDEGEVMKLEGTIYTWGMGDFAQFYSNPVYQSPDGKVYLVSGSGISMSGVMGEGAAMTKTLTGSVTTTENGVSSTNSTEIRVSLQIMYKPVSVSIIQMSADSETVSRETFKAGELPEEYAVKPETEYIIVETVKLDNEGKEHTTRQVFGPDDVYISAFYAQEDGLCIAQPCTIKW